MTETLKLDPSQERAVELICRPRDGKRFGIVTGGPGTGKTTTTKIALDELDRLGVRYLLAAPTGKAARRMQEATGREAKTIHRLLEFGPGGGFFRNEKMPLEAEVVLVDEASMIDIELGASLLKAIGPRTRLVLIGDADQLPPVGPGRLFGDLVDSGEVPLARLNTLHRSALESWIHVSAQRVLRGEVPDLQKRKDFRFIEIGDDRAIDILPAVEKVVTELIPREIDAPNQVLIPQRPGVAGIDAANARLQQTLNPKKADARFLPRKGGTELRVGDRVIQTRNDYKLCGGQGVFNGELGDIVEIEKSGVIVHFADRGEVAYTLEQSNALQLAYALTVHRFQGSEIPWAVVVCHSTHTFILTRQLIYTAITRGKQGVILVGNRKGLETALNAKKPPKRNTALIERMHGELEAPPPASVPAQQQSV